MLSNLYFSLLETPTISALCERLKPAECDALCRWYETAVGHPAAPAQAAAALLWCTGAAADDLSAGAAALSLTPDAVTRLYATHCNLFCDDPAEKRPSGTPLFIVFEGLDGSGKSTQIRLLQESLRQRGRRVAVTAEPTVSTTGGLIRDALCGAHPRTAEELAGLFLADRIAHNQNPAWGIQKLTADGQDVLCDRYYYSSFAYQGLSTDLQWVMDMNRHCPQIRRPDLCIYLDVDPRRCMQRLETERTHLEIFETDETLIKTRAQFLKVFRQLNQTENLCILNANRPVAAVAADVLAAVTALWENG